MAQDDGCPPAEGRLEFLFRHHVSFRKTTAQRFRLSWRLLRNCVLGLAMTGMLFMTFAQALVAGRFDC